MSTKIYDAYEYKGKDIHSLLTWLKKFKDDNWDFCINTFIGAVTDPSKFDTLALCKEFEVSFSRMGKTDPLCWVSSVMIYPHDGRLFVIFFSCRNEFINVRLFKDFHYQDQGDRPARLTKKVWENRKKTWSKILAKGKYNGRFADCGFSFSVIDESDAFKLSYEIGKRLKESGKIKDIIDPKRSKKILRESKAKVKTFGGKRDGSSKQ